MIRSRTAQIVLLSGLALGLVACSPAEEPMETTTPAAEEMAEPAPAAAMTASATLQGAAGSTVAGSITFTETAGGVQVTAHVSGVGGPKEHGFHVHETGDCSAPDFTSAGGHFNPEGHPHGGPQDMERHAGDLGNITIGDDGSGHLELTTNMLTVSAGPSSVVGRAVILHAQADDLVSQPTGDAGGRIACGVVAADATM